MPINKCLLFLTTSCPTAKNLSGCTGRKEVSVQFLRKHITRCFYDMDKTPGREAAADVAENRWQLHGTDRQT